MIRRMPAVKANVFTIPRLGAVPAVADRGAARRQARARLSRRAATRSNSARPRSICRRGAPAGSRATSSSTNSKATPPSCRASSRSAISTKTRSPSPKPPPANWREAALALPAAIAPLERRLLLAQLIAQWAERIAPDQGSPLIANTPSAALGLADDLARLIDDMITRQVPWDRLDKLVPDALDRYWQIALDFLKIARGYWPERLKELDAVEAAERRDMLIEAEAKRLAGSTAPVIAAGSTGSMPATAKLLATIAKLPHGAVVLPGLDMDLDDASWALIAGDADDKTHDGAPAAGHAQFAMHALLDRIGITRGDVAAACAAAPRTAASGWSRKRCARPPPPSTGRRAPAAKDFAAATDSALASLALIEAANAEDEALAIAVALRETLETAGTRPPRWSRPTARWRAASSPRSERWQVKVDDSGGDSLADTSAGVFARLAAQAALGGLEPVTLLALLKHPLLRLGAKAGAHNAAIATLERALLRGPRPRPGSDALGQALSTFRANRAELHRSDPRGLIDDDKFDVAAELIARLGAALAPLERLKPGAHPLAELAKCHSAVISGLGRDGKGDVAAFAGNDGTALLRAFEELSESPTAADACHRATATMPNCSTPPSPSAWCAARRRRTCACASSARWKRACRLSSASCSAASTKAPGRPRRAAIPGSAARCAPNSASIRRSGASALPRTTSRKAWAPKR